MTMKTGVLKILTLLMLLSSAFTSSHAMDSGYRGLLVEPAKLLQSQPLIDHTGSSISFPQHNGRMKIVFFGYTSCPDVCPMTLHKVKTLINKLGTAADELDFCFVSIDPLRDDTSQLHHFVTHYDKRITGITGEARAIKALENEFGILTRKFQGKSAFAYTLEHSVFIYLLDRQGQLRVMYPASMSVEEIIKDIELLGINDENLASAD